LTLQGRDATVSLQQSTKIPGMKARSDPDMLPLAELFLAAASMLIGETAVEGPPRDLLARLDYLDDKFEQAPHRAALLRAASGFNRIFMLDAADAPGLVTLGAEVDPAGVGVAGAPLASVSGTGLTFRQAFESCVGEGVEHLSQYPARDDFIEQLTGDEALAGASPALRDLWERLLPYRSGSVTTWTLAADLADGHAVRLPAGICFRRPMGERDIDPPWPLSTGCGAGPDHLSATLHGLLELVERDAVALWWRGGRRARLLPGDAGASVLARLRGGASRRRTWFLDVTTDIAIPVVVAASCNEDGFGLCCGFAARTTVAGAADNAAREMAQMELAWRITDTKRSVRGEAALNAVDRQHLRRFTTIDVAETPALRPLVPPAAPCDLPAHDAITALAEVRARLEAAGLAPCALNLTRDVFAIPVVRAICPGLEPGMTSPPGPRLREAAHLSGCDPADISPL
jgi:ribosomal protein S12 methylthiotransferase accessory factor